MITANKTVAEGLLLHMVGHKPRTKGYRLADKYRDLLGNPSSDPLRQVRVYGLK